MPQINTLIKDIYAVTQKKGGGLDAHVATLSANLAVRLGQQFGPREHRHSLRLSQMGARCPRAVWYSVHHPELAEALPPWSEVKYAFGHVLEELAIALTKAAGHEVTGEQDEVSVDGILGHRDCVIDGCVVDVKSSSTRSFEKFRKRLLEHNDSFGYLEQLDGYLLGSASDPLVTVKDRAYLLAIDKQLGHMCLYEHRLREAHIRDRIKTYRMVIERDSPPLCSCQTVAEGEAGNIGLDVTASYNSFKYQCFPHLRTFLYSNGPKYLTKVVKRPTNKYGPITEIDKFGKTVYN